ncbi:uncharacterized protein BN461_00231 [Bacteroides sp. CAG:1076]|nr:uncharacterized protein BN461_00231 [Bacteroides sp. CAG:1076]
MNNKSINSNKQFMIENGILAFGVFFIVCLFLYLSFRAPKTEQKVSSDLYTIQIGNSLVGDSISVYVNDSLLLNCTMGSTALTLQVNRFAEENALMIVDNQSDEITPFSLNPKGSIINIEKENGKIAIKESERE